jgi:hypothetical protein
MRGRLNKKFMVVATSVAMALAVVPISQAESCEMQQECDQASISIISTFQSQPQEMHGLGMMKSLANSQIVTSERIEESQNVRHEQSKDSSYARKTKEFAMRKPCREMNDREMDGTCGGITGSFDMTQSGNMTLTDNSVQSISLSDQAQQNLSSLVNILSINSTISVMLNLNVNINSTVGTVTQGNTGTQGPP